MAKIYLASTSPRRKELLSQLIGKNFEIINSNYEEDNTLNIEPKELVMLHAKGKGRDASKNMKSGIIISADTLISINNEVLGKPITKENTISHLSNISDKIVEIISGLYVIDLDNNKEYQDFEITKLKIAKLDDKFIKDYVDSEEPLDKAGGFGIQDRGAIIVEKIDGCYFNVVGLPLFKLNKILKNVGVNIFDFNTN